MVRRYLPGTLGIDTGIDSDFLPMATGAGATTSPMRSGTTRSSSSAGIPSRGVTSASSTGGAASTSDPAGPPSLAGLSAGRATAGPSASGAAEPDGLASGETPGLASAEAGVVDVSVTADGSAEPVACGAATVASSLALAGSTTGVADASALGLAAWALGLGAGLAVLLGLLVLAGAAEASAAGAAAGFGVADGVGVSEPATAAGAAAGPTSFAGSAGATATSIGSQRTLAWRPVGSAFRSLILNATSTWPLVPADGRRLMSGVLRTSLVPISVGASGRSDSIPLLVVALASRGEPAAPASTSREARPVFITTERVNPDVGVSVSIWAT